MLSTGGKMLSTGGNNISGLNWDNSTVGVGNKTSISKTVDSNGVDNSSSGSMSNLGGIDSRLISRDNNSVGMGNKSVWVSNSIWVGISSIADREDVSELS